MIFANMFSANGFSFRCCTLITTFFYQTTTKSLRRNCLMRIIASKTGAFVLSLSVMLATSCGSDPSYSSLTENSQSESVNKETSEIDPENINTKNLIDIGVNLMSAVGKEASKKSEQMTDLLMKLIGPIHETSDSIKDRIKDANNRGQIMSSAIYHINNMMKHPISIALVDIPEIPENVKNSLTGVRNDAKIKSNEEIKKQIQIILMEKVEETTPVIDNFEKSLRNSGSHLLQNATKLLSGENSNFIDDLKGLINLGERESQDSTIEGQKSKIDTSTFMWLIGGVFIFLAVATKVVAALSGIFGLLATICVVLGTLSIFI